MKNKLHDCFTIQFGPIYDYLVKIRSSDDF